MMCEPCLYCHGEGMLKSRRTICHEIFRKISRMASKITCETITLQVHPRVAGMMLKEEAAIIDYLENATGKRITIEPIKDLHVEKYEILWDEQ